jgi:dTDP-4-dehydrorhamnose 3,5-epimerase-like enzyme
MARPGSIEGVEVKVLTAHPDERGYFYDPEEEGRIPHDVPGIGYDRAAGPSIK